MAGKKHQLCLVPFENEILVLRFAMVKAVDAIFSNRKITERNKTARDEIRQRIAVVKQRQAQIEPSTKQFEYDPANPFILSRKDDDAPCNRPDFAVLLSGAYIQE